MPATRTRRRGRTRSQGRKSTRGAATRPRASRARPARTTPGALTRGRAAAGRQLSGHRHDVFAVGLVVLGVLCALGLWTALAGPVGDGLADGLGVLMGRARVAIPIGCIVFAGVLLWPHHVANAGGEPGEHDDEATEP